MATVRPPANEAHYHNPQSEGLFDATVKFLNKFSEVKLVVLPRNERQTDELKARWRVLFANGTMRIPARAMDGLNLIWYSDLVISGGGTMNREAAALGVPVYSVFRGNIGAVDRHLTGRGRLVLLESVQGVETKIRVKRWSRPHKPQTDEGATLSRIVGQNVTILKQKRPLLRNEIGDVSPSIDSVGVSEEKE